MNQNPLDQAWQVASARPYAGKLLGNWLAKWAEMPEKELEKLNSQFLKTLATWVVRKFRDGRKGGVPTGYLDRFILSGDQPINLTETLSAMVVGTLRKRGLREFDTLPTPTFKKLVDAWDRAKQNSPRR